ncbi:MAG: PKD domain-containing protein [Candidatus Thermoplasmatota archaeon]|nr:PKD domain-containing protein [Candidatus Thermoplasmatota archaeon]
MRNLHLVIICISILIVSVSGCIDNDEKEKEEVYILEAVISVNKNVVWIVYPDEKSETITFDASFSKGDIEKCYWNFTGGNNWDDEGAEVTCEYGESGHYIVKLKVVDVNEESDYDTVDVYVNYKAEYEGNITKDEKEKSYFFPLKTSAQSATITLQYEPYDPYPYTPIIDNVNDIDLYVYYNESDDSEVKNSSTLLDPKATGTIEEAIKLSRSDLLWNLTGMRASVKWADDCPPSDNPIDYTLLIEVYYN